MNRPAQFAAICTDSEFNVIGEPEVFTAKPADDYLPQPGAVLITGITRRKHGRKEKRSRVCRPYSLAFYRTEDLYSGLQQCAFRRRSHTQRFYRNFYDPYARSWQHDNSRWDLLDVMRACYALRPEGINWPENDDGLPSFRLEHLTKANGIEHSNAHDAMADVYATIAMAKLVKRVSHVCLIISLPIVINTN